MKHKTVKTAAAAALVAGAMLSVPLAAHAATIYPPANACTAPATVASGGTVTFSCEGGTFQPNETVSITVTGENGAAATIGFVKFAVSTAHGSAHADSDGALPAVPIRLPKDASGVYTISVASANSTGGSASVSIAAPAGSGSSNPGSGGSAGGTLPVTGIDSGALLGVWVGGGALILAGGAIAVAATVRNRKQAR